ncbi:GPCR kinase [Artemisia annua]|uniref:GPCR kinase n=1 Tax=Artemisia annua TaxID=35608 RepID=A0A2U1L6S9_ARTAN|nr:GPCR kinase [Artemisia annua]
MALLDETELINMVAELRFSRTLLAEKVIKIHGMHNTKNQGHYTEHAAAATMRTIVEVPQVRLLVKWIPSPTCYRGLRFKYEADTILANDILLACGLLDNENCIDPILKDIEQKFNTEGMQVNREHSSPMIGWRLKTWDGVGTQHMEFESKLPKPTILKHGWKVSPDTPPEKSSFDQRKRIQGSNSSKHQLKASRDLLEEAVSVLAHQENENKASKNQIEEAESKLCERVKELNASRDRLEEAKCKLEERVNELKASRNQLKEVESKERNLLKKAEAKCQQLKDEIDNMNSSMIGNSCQLNMVTLQHQIGMRSYRRSYGYNNVIFSLGFKSPLIGVQHGLKRLRV